MFKQRICSTEDFSKLAEETERLAQQVEDIRQRMAAASKKRQCRLDLLTGYDTTAAQRAPGTSSASSEGPSSSHSSPPPPAYSSSPPPPPAPKKPSSGVFRVMPDRDAGRYCFLEERGTKEPADSPELPSVSKRKIPA